MQSLPYHIEKLPLGAHSKAPSQDEWKLMIDQDLHLGCITGDSGHGTMIITGETESTKQVEQLVGGGGGNSSASGESPSDVKWREDDPLLEFDDDNVMKPQASIAVSTPVQACEEQDVVAPTFESPIGKKSCFKESIADRLSKTAPSRLKCNYDDKELVGFTGPPLVNVIPWIKYEAQNMAEPSFWQELQCIRGTEHLQYIVAMIVWLKCWKQNQGWWAPIPTCNF